MPVVPGKAYIANWVLYEMLMCHLVGKSCEKGHSVLRTLSYVACISIYFFFSITIVEMNSSNTTCRDSDYSNHTCFKLEQHYFEPVFRAKTVVQMLGVVTGCLVILMIVQFKAYKNFVQRLHLYLAVAAMFNCITFTLNSLPVVNRCGYMFVTNERFCQASAFLDQYATWVILLLVCWITLQFFLLGVFKRNYKSHKYELVGVVITLVVPLVASSIPFIDLGNGSMYGLAGTWCWIKTTDDDCNELIEGDIEQFVLWYGTVMVFVTLNILAMLAVVIVLYRGTQQERGRLQHQYKEALKETRPLVFCTFIFSIVYTLSFVDRVHYANTKISDSTLWVIHAIAQSSLPLCLTLAFLLYPGNLKRVRKAAKQLRHQSEFAETHFIVSKEDETAQEALIIRGTKRDPSSLYSFPALS